MGENYDGLESEYDLILYGTGLCESIISCAAGKAGLKVLHLDRNDYYGDKFNSHALQAHIELFTERHSSDAKSISENVIVEEAVDVRIDSGITDFYVAGFSSVQYSKLPNPISYVRGKSVRNDLDVNKVHPSCFGYAMEKDPALIENEKYVEQSHPSFYKHIKHSKMSTLSRIMSNRNRDFNIDCTSKLILGTGLFIDSLVSSSVHKYLEFKSVEGLSYYLSEKEGLWKVPCSRGDVFNTTNLSALEKRVFMKFYTFVLDYGRDVISGKDVTTINENELATGRSLYRPQNKEKEYSGYDVHKYADLPFEDFLTSCKLSPKLQSIIMYALCFRVSACKSSNLADAYPTTVALKDLYEHINSLGRFGDTAFLAPLYGCSEITQAFCRMSAVWGSVFILRCGVDSIKLKSTDNETAQDTPAKSSLEVTDTNGRVFKCKAFVTNLHHFPSSGTFLKSLPLCYGFSVTRVCVCWGYLLGEDRGIAIIPPNAVGKNGFALQNTHAIHVSQTDRSASSSCEGSTILHVTTILNLNDELLTKVSNGLSWREAAEACSESAVQLMDRVIGFLQTLAPTQRTVHNDNDDSTYTVSNDFQVWTNTTTLCPLYRDRTPSESEGTTGLPTTIGLSYDTNESFHLNDVIEKSKRIFQQLFPGKDFLPEEKLDEEDGVAGEDVAEGGEQATGIPRKILTGEQSEEELETQFLEATLNALKTSDSSSTNSSSNVSD